MKSKKRIVCFGPGPMFKGGIANYNTSLAKAFDKIDNISLALIILYNVFYLKFILNKYLIRGFKALVYFILYICTFEIIPVLGVLYLIK